MTNRYALLLHAYAVRDQTAMLLFAFAAGVFLCWHVVNLAPWGRRWTKLVYAGYFLLFYVGFLSCTMIGGL